MFCKKTPTLLNLEFTPYTEMIEVSFSTAFISWTLAALYKDCANDMEDR